MDSLSLHTFVSLKGLGMRIKAIVGALIGAVVGAVIWGGVTYYTNYEIGWIAWGVGALVGMGAAWGGARGAMAGCLCAVIALGAIFAGKMMAVRWVIDKHRDEIMAEALGQEAYKDFQIDVADFAKVTDEAKYPQFMIDHKYVEAASSQEVSSADLMSFNREHVPALKAAAVTMPGYEEWQRSEKPRVLARLGSSDLVAGAVIGDLGGMDILFGLLGIVTAFRIGSSKEHEG